jgi:hypothetical protein
MLGRYKTALIGGHLQILRAVRYSRKHSRVIEVIHHDDPSRIKQFIAGQDVCSATHG